MMESVFLPLLILVFKWRTFSKYDWAFTFYYLLYAMTLVTTKDMPLYSRIGSFYLGVPAFCYTAFIFSELQDSMNENVVRVLSALGLSSALVAILFIF